MQPLPFGPGEPFPFAAVRAHGISARALARAVDDGHFVKIRHGWYCRTPDEDDTHTSAHTREVEAALSAGPDGAVASHTSAALLHGLPLIDAPAHSVHLSQDRSTGARVARGLTLHSAPRGLQVVEKRGLPVTSVAQTVADVARTCGFVTGVCAADRALYKELMTAEEFAAEVERHRGRTGAATLREVAAFADGLSESPGESLSRCVIARFPEIPRPRLQHEFHRPDGSFVARTDFDWDGRLVGEFDGKTKYTGRAGPGEDPGEVAWKEKRREDEIRALGPFVVRWIWADLYQPARLRRILRDGFTRAGLR